MGIVLKDSFKTFSHDQDKTRNPEDTVRLVRERLDRLDIKILEKTLRIDTGRLGIPVYISLCGPDATRFTHTKKQMGKGASAAQSEASAVMELMERFSFFSYLEDHPRRSATFREVAAVAVPVEFFPRSVRDRTTPMAKVQALLDDLPLRWVPGTNLSRRCDMLVPLDWFALINEYNGPAAGNTMEEAILQSLCEVVERHVGSIICHDQLVTPVIDPTSLSDPAALELVDKFQRAGIRMFLRDFSLDTGIPTVGALAYDPDSFPHWREIVFTAGTTSNPEKSLCRALTEIAQLAGDFENRTSYRPTLPKYQTLEEAAYLMADGPSVSIRELPDLTDANLKVEIERCVAALNRIDLEVLTIDVTHPRLEIPAVYTIIPGAHFLDHTRNTDFAQHAARTIVNSLPPAAAAHHLRRLEQLFGPRYDFTFFQAHSLELQGDAERALTLFETALTQQPDARELASIHVHIGSCLKDLGRYHEAVEALDRAAAHNEELKEIYNLKGFCLYQLKQHQAAIEVFEKAIELDPGSAIDYANIGSNLRELGHLEEAVRLYKMALELDPEIEFARTNLVKLEPQLAAATGGA